jgi:hypothetical protein
MASLGRYCVCKATEEMNLTYLTLLSLGELLNRDAMFLIAVSCIFFVRRTPFQFDLKLWIR